MLPPPDRDRRGSTHHWDRQVSSSHRWTDRCPLSYHCYIPMLEYRDVLPTTLTLTLLTLLTPTLTLTLLPQPS